MITAEELKEILNKQVFDTLWPLLGNPYCEILEPTEIGRPPFRGGPTRTTFRTKAKVPCLIVTVERRNVSDPNERRFSTEIFLKQEDLDFKLSTEDQLKIRGVSYRIQEVIDLAGIFYRVILR